ncbi:hypothetical protein KCU99_g175, partial [Aureobasidium melanogenum]
MPSINPSLINRLLSVSCLTEPLFLCDLTATTNIESCLATSRLMHESRSHFDSSISERQLRRISTPRNLRDSSQPQRLLSPTFAGARWCLISPKVFVSILPSSAVGFRSSSVVGKKAMNDNMTANLLPPSAHKRPAEPIQP